MPAKKLDNSGLFYSDTYVTWCPMLFVPLQKIKTGIKTTQWPAVMQPYISAVKEPVLPPEHHPEIPAQFNTSV
jgi:hypothetical protein